MFKKSKQVLLSFIAAVLLISSLANFAAIFALAGTAELIGDQLEYYEDMFESSRLNLKKLIQKNENSQSISAYEVIYDLYDVVEEAIEFFHETALEVEEFDRDTLEGYDPDTDEYIKAKDTEKYFQFIYRKDGQETEMLYFKSSDSIQITYSGKNDSYVVEYYPTKKGIFISVALQNASQQRYFVERALFQKNKITWARRNIKKAYKIEDYTYGKIPSSWDNFVVKNSQEKAVYSGSYLKITIDGRSRTYK